MYAIRISTFCPYHQQRNIHNKQMLRCKKNQYIPSLSYTKIISIIISKEIFNTSLHLRSDINYYLLEVDQRSDRDPVGAVVAGYTP